MILYYFLSQKDENVLFIRLFIYCGEMEKRAKGQVHKQSWERNETRQVARVFFSFSLARKPNRRRRCLLCLFCLFKKNSTHLDWFLQFYFLPSPCPFNVSVVSYIFFFLCSSPALLLKHITYNFIIIIWNKMISTVDKWAKFTIYLEAECFHKVGHRTYISRKTHFCIYC